SMGSALRLAEWYLGGAPQQTPGISLPHGGGQRARTGRSGLHPPRLVVSVAHLCRVLALGGRPAPPVPPPPWSPQRAAAREQHRSASSSQPPKVRSAARWALQFAATGCVHAVSWAVG